MFTLISHLGTFLPFCPQKCIQYKTHYVQVNMYKTKNARTGTANTAQRAVISDGTETD